MRPARCYKTGITALAGGLLLLSGVNSVLAKEGPSALYVVSVKQVGDYVEVTLMNPNSGALTGKLVVTTVVDGKPTLAVVPFTAWGGQKVFVEWAPPAPTDEVKGLGIIVDDGAPI